MRCVFENIGPSEKVAGWFKYECQCCWLIGHSPHPAVIDAEGIERVIGPLCRCGDTTQQPKNAGLTDAEVKELLPDEDPTLIGNRIAALTAALGIPTCGGCEARRLWLNAAHQWLRSH